MLKLNQDIFTTDLNMEGPGWSPDPDPGFCQELDEGIVPEDENDMEVEENDNADRMVPEPEVSEVVEAQEEGEDLGLDVGLSSLDCGVDGARVPEKFSIQ